MDQVLERCAGRDLSLNSTRAAHSLYLSMGFVDEAHVHMRQGIVEASLPMLPPLDGLLTMLGTDRLDEIIALDTRAFGTDRGRLLKLLAENASIAVLRRGGEIVGYSMKREFGRGHVIAPIVATSTADALHLAATHLERLKGQFARIDTRELGGPFAEFLQQSGLLVAETVTTMSKGRRFLSGAEGDPKVFGLAGHALS
jgi:hypothetical protein